MLGWAYGRAGQAAKAHAVLQRLADIGKARRVSPFQLAWVALVAWVTDPTEDCA